MEELWQQTSELLWQRPLLWLPVLVMDLLAFVAAVGSAALMRSVVLSRLQYHSVLGGPPMREQVSPAALQHANLVAALITLPADYLRLLLYAIALVITVALTRAYRVREEKPFTLVAPALQANVAAIFSLSLRALAIYGGLALISGWLGESLLKHGHAAVLAGGWLDLGFGLVRVALLAWLLAPLAVELLSRGRLGAPRRQHLQLFAFALGVVSLLLGKFTTENMRAVHIASTPVRYALEMTGSWIVALPYAIFFVMTAVVVIKTAAEADRTSA